MAKNQQVLAQIGGGSLAVLLSLGLGQQASALPLVENLSQPNASVGAINLGTWQGSSFTTGSSSYNLDSVTLLFRENAANPNDLFVSLYSDNSGSLGSLITNFTAPNFISSTLGQNTFSLPTSQSLTANTTYWLVSGVSNAVGDYSWGFTTSSNQTGLPGWDIGGYIFTNDQGGTWNSSAFSPYQFSVNGTENATNIPEPSSVVALLGLGGLGLVSSLKKRK